MSPTGTVSGAYSESETVRVHKSPQIGAVKCRSKSIFDEAGKQEYSANDPGRKLRIPNNLRPKDKQALNWEQLWLIWRTQAEMGSI